MKNVCATVTVPLFKNDIAFSGLRRSSLSKSRSKSGRRSSLMFLPVSDPVPSIEVEAEVRKSSLNCRNEKLTLSPKPVQEHKDVATSKSQNCVSDKEDKKDSTTVQTGVATRRRTRSMARSSINVISVSETQQHNDNTDIEMPVEDIVTVDSVPTEAEVNVVDDSPVIVSEAEIESEDTEDSSVPTSNQSDTSDDTGPSVPVVSIVVHSPPGKTFHHDCEADVDDIDDETTVAYDVTAYYKSLQSKPSMETHIEENQESKVQVQNVQHQEDGTSEITEQPSSDIPETNSITNFDQVSSSRDPSLTKLDGIVRGTPEKTDEVSVSPDKIDEQRTSPNNSGEERAFFSTFIKLKDEEPSNKQNTFKRPQPLQRKQPISRASEKKHKATTLGKQNKNPLKTNNSLVKPKSTICTSSANTVQIQKENCQNEESGPIVSLEKSDRRGTFVIPKSKPIKDRRGTFVVEMENKDIKKAAKNKRGTFCVSKNILPMEDNETLEDINSDILVDSGDECDSNMLPTTPPRYDETKTDMPPCDFEPMDQTLYDTVDMSMTEIISSAAISLMACSTAHNTQLAQMDQEGFKNATPDMSEKSDEEVPTESDVLDDKHSEGLELEECQASPQVPSEIKRARSSRQCKAKALKAIEACAQMNDTNNDSLFVTPATPNSEKKDEKLGKKFNAYLSKPGKIKFMAGRKDMSDYITKKPKSRSKSRSTLPTIGKPRSKQARSKTRLLSRESLTLNEPLVQKSVYDFQNKHVGSEKDPLKSAFDISLSDSVCAAAKPSLTQYRERQQVRKEQEMEVANDEPTISEKNRRARSLDTFTQPQGIMLVAANGKRTKPRQRSKSVRYAKDLTKIRITSPIELPHSDSISSVSSVDTSSDSSRHVSDSTSGSSPDYKDLAGNTPLRPVKQVKHSHEVVPESPLVFPDFESRVSPSQENHHCSSSGGVQSPGLSKRLKRCLVVSPLTSELEEDLDTVFECGSKTSQKSRKSSLSISQKKSDQYSRAKSPASKLKKSKLKTARNKEVSI